MRRTLKILIAVVLLFIPLHLMLLNKPAIKSVDDMLALHTDLVISSEQLVTDFVGNEKSANQQYVERTVKVTGQVKEISFKNDQYTLFLEGNGDSACMMCSMVQGQDEKLDGIKLGQTVSLKGICKGFLIDAIVMNCVLLNAPNNE